MEKLEPILKHHFWILAFLVLPLGLWGYYSANSSLNAATQEREAALDGIYGTIQSGESPNDTWDEGMKLIADEYEQAAAIATANLHESQEALMDWPPLMASRQPDEYWGQWPGQLRFSYSDARYPELRRELWERYEPVVVDPEDTKPVTWEEKVLIDIENIKPEQVFANPQSPTNDEVWQAQEDIWIHRLLADAVVRMNDGADGPYTAPVRSVKLVELMGGDGVRASGGAGGAQTGPAMAAGMPGSSERAQMQGMSGMGGGRGFGGQPANNNRQDQFDIEFDPAEEIGGNGRTAAGAGGRNGPPGMGGRTPGGTPGSSQDAATIHRYVRFNPNDKFRVRAFYMSVIVEQSKFPEFLVELCNSEWPVQIVRFNVGPNPDYFPEGTARRSQTGPGTTPMGTTPTGNVPRTGTAGRSTMSPTGRNQQNHEAYGALDSSDLVQLDVLGLVTIFTPPDAPPATAAATTSLPEVEPADEAAEDDAATDVDTDAATDDTDAETDAADAVEEDADAAVADPMETTEPDAGEAEATTEEVDPAAEADAATPSQPEESEPVDESAGTSEPAESSESGENPPEEESPPEDASPPAE